MALLILGLVLVIGMHSLRIVMPNWQTDVAKQIGRGPYIGLYSFVSTVGLVLIVWGFARAWQAPVFLYTPPSWGRHLTLLLMLPALILVFTSIFPIGRIKRLVGHPLLTATMLWGLGHLFANGDLAGVVLFSAFLAWAVIDRIMQPADSIVTTNAVSSGHWDIAAVFAGAALYGVLHAGLHYWVFGVSPLL
jgi:uncharacterized membrane protein